MLRQTLAYCSKLLQTLANLSHSLPQFAMKKANALEMLHSIPRFARTIGRELMYNMESRDITSYNLASYVMDECFFMEWKNASLSYKV